MVEVERVGWYSIGINCFLTLLNLTIALASGSLAVAAEMIHNLVDLMASVAVLVGLKISKRESHDFPYGLYKVENVVAVGIAFLIFLTGYEIARQAIFGLERQTTVNVWILAGVALSMIIPWAFSRYEMRVGRAANSPSLIADAQEYRVHIFSSGVVLVALAGQWAGLPLDRVAALVVVVLVVKTGWELLSDGMRVLLDASIDAETLYEVREIIQSHSAVVNVKSLTGRNAGRYRFLESEIGVRVADLEKAHQLSHVIEESIRQHVPHIERVLIQVEPAQKPVQRVAVSVYNEKGTVSQHFGTAPFFTFIDVRVADGARLRHQVVINPHRMDEKQRGLRVAHWLINEGVDVVISGDDLHEKAPGYVLADAGVTASTSSSNDLETTLKEWREEVTSSQS